jgi:hypothetical protein
MVRIAACLALAGGVLVTGTAAGCSGSDSSATRSSQSGPVTSAAPGVARPTTDPRKEMPLIKPGTVGQIGYGPASATDRARFARALKASGGLVVSKSASTLTVSGRDVGGVAVYSTKKGLAKRPVFEDQYVVQLINAVTGRSRHHGSSRPTVRSWPCRPVAPQWPDGSKATGSCSSTGRQRHQTSPTWPSASNRLP